jgi:UDP-GlcNAc:undecaprenyl-phosphate GlcNAc-1-phosphate transferase
MMLCLLVAVSVAGFLVFNLPLPRARIFMGDGGSQFLGYMLACLPLITDRAGLATISMPYAAAVLLIPIFDTFAALWRRKREGRGFFDPDQFHLHHKLLLIGFSKRATLVVVMAFQFLISTFIALAGWTGGLISAVLVIAVYLMGILFFTVIHIRKEDALVEKNGKN